MADKLIITYEEYTKIVEKLAIQIHKNYKPTVLVGIMRGAAPIIDILSRVLKFVTGYQLWVPLLSLYLLKLLVYSFYEFELPTFLQFLYILQK